MRKSRIRALKKQFQYATGHMPNGKREVGTTKDGYTVYFPSEIRRLKKGHFNG